MRRMEHGIASNAIKISEAPFPLPFPSGLEYSSPARGTWNIVHVGMLIPEVHQIFICAQGCLRGVVLTAAEMGASKRFSTVAIREKNVLEGDLEQLVVDGVSDIIESLPKKPPAILVYTSCIHHFMGCDLPLVYQTLNQKYPMLQFADCYMNPIMRKSGLNPDQTMRRQLYSLLKPREINPKSVSLIGNNFPYHPTNEMSRLLRDNGYMIREVASCKTYQEYQEMAESSLYITTFPAAKPAGDMLQERLGQKHLYLPLSFDYDEILWGLTQLCETLELDLPDYSKQIQECETALQHAYEIIGQTPITLDYTAFSRPLSLAKLLLKHGFHLTRIYVDGFNQEEEKDFRFLQKEFPHLWVYPTIQPRMRIEPRKTEEKTLAIGQKAAYFTGSDYFVNVVEGSGMYGFDAIIRLAALMIEAYQEPKDMRSLIQIKGMGCECKP